MITNISGDKSSTNLSTLQLIPRKIDRYKDKKRKLRLIGLSLIICLPSVVFSETVTTFLDKSDLSLKFSTNKLTF